MIDTFSVETENSRSQGYILRRLHSRASLPSDKKANAIQSEDLHPEGIQRLWAAIINRAIRDVLDDGSYASGAERWLLSREFDRIHSSLG
jgi:hypothetical protein